MSAALLTPNRSTTATLPKLRVAACRRAVGTEQIRGRLLPIAAQLELERAELRAELRAEPWDTFRNTSWDDTVAAPSSAGALHAAVLAGRLDFALHRLRDLCRDGTPILPEGLVLAALLPREDARDAVVLAPDTPPVFRRVAIPELPIGACLGLNDPRREAQLRHLRPDLRFRALPGDAAARLRALRNGDQSATVLSMADLRRLDHPRAAVLPLDPEAMVPAAGQGILAVTARTADAATRRLLRLVDDAHSRVAWAAEAAVLRALGEAAAQHASVDGPAPRNSGSSPTPRIFDDTASAHARALPGGLLRLHAAVPGPTGLHRMELAGPRDEAEQLGTTLGKALARAARATIYGA